LLETPLKERPRHETPALQGLLVALLLAVFFTQAAAAWRLKAPTFDEPTHLAAGWSYLVGGEYRLNPEHPPLLKQWAALPLLTLRLGSPEDYPGWEMMREGRLGHQGTFAHYFLYEGNDFDRMFWRARLAMIALATLLGLWIYGWSRELWGPSGGMLSLALFAFSPNLIAHAGIVGSDYGLAAFGLLSLWLWARWLAAPSWTRTALAGLGCALALLTKFSALQLIPLWLGGWIWVSVRPASSSSRCCEREPSPAPDAHRPLSRFWAARWGLLLSIIGLAVALDYGFEVEALGAGLETFARHLGQGHHAYFRGQVSDSGWPAYFVVAYLIKTPLPEMIFVIWGSMVSLRRREDRRRWAALAIAWLYVLITASLGRVAIGYRHILLMVPLGLVMAGGVAADRRSEGPAAIGARESHGRRRRPWRWAAAALLGWQVIGAAVIFPDHLTFFNELIGGPKRGWKWLSDSNLDWGQDLTTLSRWMRREGVPWVYLAYFGTAEPRRYGVEYLRLPGYNMLQDPIVPVNLADPPPGHYAIFATNLGGQYLVDPDTYGWFRRRQPEARLGGSVFIYRVSP